MQVECERPLLVDDCLLEIAPLSDDEVETIMNKELLRNSRTLTVEQRLVRPVAQPVECNLAFWGLI